ncbi:MAG: carbon starvation protein A [Bacteroidales bacterium]|nr:carbon starvation protein A [Bacteroidales bacterium]
MITFLICLVLLVVAYFVYGRYLERVVGADQTAACPSESCFDGVDYVPLPKWKTFLIQLLNIAGLGPIFGAVLGATYGPVAFLWITFGGIFLGAMHDYISGMISVKNKGVSLPEITGKYLGNAVRQGMRVFTVVLLVLVGAVFMLGPAGILGKLTGFTELTLGGFTLPKFWVWVILIYYVIATLLPVNKIIAKIYPLFGAALIFMALGIFGALLFGPYRIPELTTVANMKSDAARFPIIPTMFITIACGAISGFHATQSPLMARCVKTEREGRPVFFGAMISESIIALIWAAVAMAFFGNVHGLNDALAAHGNDAAWAVDHIANSTLGRIGGLLALLGVVAAPISTGDTAFRSARLIVADFLGLEQKQMRKRLYISVPLFVAGFAITLMRFDVVWRYFAWANQTLAVLTLWTITVYLYTERKPFWLALVPAVFMTFITSDYFFTSGEMLNLPQGISLWLASAATLLISVAILRMMRRKGRRMA